MPDDPRLADFEKAIALLHEGRGKEALMILDDLLIRSDHPSDKLQLQVQAAGTAGQIGDFKEMERRLLLAEQFLASVPAEEIGFAFYLEKFRYLAQTGEFKSAFDYADYVATEFSLVLQDDEFAGVVKELDEQRGILATCLHRYDVAMPFLKSALKCPQPDGALWLYLGQCQVGLKQYEEARDSLLNAERLGVPSKLIGMLHYNFAVLFIRQGEFESARKHLEQARVGLPFNAPNEKALRELSARLARTDFVN